MAFLPGANAQTLTVLHNFTGGADGASPSAGLMLDRGGNLYGTTSLGGNINCFGSGCGTVYKLQHRGSGWTLSPLYLFNGEDGEFPGARVVFGPDGALYGTTASGGTSSSGTVFRLQPPSSFCPTVSCSWIETVLHTFTDHPDGAGPGNGDVVFDSSGNLYGATTSGGTSDFTCANDSPCGTVYKVSHVQGGWVETVIYNFFGLDDGAFPNGVAFDSSGNLVGTTSFRGANIRGTVFTLAPDGQGGWFESTLYSFSGGAVGAAPEAGVIPDGSGGFLGSTAYDGVGNGGTVWQLSPSGGNWLLTTLNSFNYSGMIGFTPPGPASVLTMDAAGNLYGTTVLDGAHNQGSVFKLTRSGSGWTFSTLHDFTGGADGGQPWGQVVLDANGNIYGTASIGGSSVGSCYQGLGCGVVFEITP
jgi:uncharacterized repeat protein (TIGR03803 family)